MDFISCYQNPFDSAFHLNPSSLSFANNSKGKVKKAAEYLLKKFSFASVSFIEPPENEGRFDINESSNSLLFSLIHESQYVAYDIFCTCSLDLGLRTLNVISKPLKEGLILNAKKYNIINSLTRYFLYQNSKMSASSMRINPVDGQIRLQYSTHFSESECSHLMENPDELHAFFEGEIKGMMKNWNRILYKVLFMINELPKDALNLENKIDPSITTQIKEVDKKIKEAANGVNQSHIEYPFMFQITDETKTKFIPHLQNLERQKKMKDFQKIFNKAGSTYFNEDCKKIMKVFDNPSIPAYSPASEDEEKICSYRQILRVDGAVMSGAKILTPLKIYSVQSDNLLEIGGFSQIRHFVVVGSKEEENDERKKFALVRKTASDEKLFWENKLISLMGNYQCLFIQKYFRPILCCQPINLTNSLLMEFCPYKSLNTYLSAYHGLLSLPIKLYFLFQISIALRFLRDMGIVHLDLKPENILMKIYTSGVNTNSCFILRLIDFGQSYWNLSEIKMQKRGITIPYASPEIVKREKKFPEKTDVYSLGVMILIMVFDINILEIKRIGPKIFNQQGDNYLKLYTVCYEKCKYLGFEPLMVCLLNLAFRCLKPEKKDRPFLDWICILLKKLMFIADEIYR